MRNKYLSFVFLLLLNNTYSFSMDFESFFDHDSVDNGYSSDSESSQEDVCEQSFIEKTVKLYNKLITNKESLDKIVIDKVQSNEKEKRALKEFLDKLREFSESNKDDENLDLNHRFQFMKSSVSTALDRYRMEKYSANRYKLDKYKCPGKSNSFDCVKSFKDIEKAEELWEQYCEIILPASSKNVYHFSEEESAYLAFYIFFKLKQNDEIILEWHNKFTKNNASTFLEAPIAYYIFRFIDDQKDIKTSKKYKNFRELLLVELIMNKYDYRPLSVGDFWESENAKKVMEKAQYVWEKYKTTILSENDYHIHKEDSAHLAYYIYENIDYKEVIEWLNQFQEKNASNFFNTSIPYYLFSFIREGSKRDKIQKNVYRSLFLINIFVNQSPHNKFNKNFNKKLYDKAYFIGIGINQGESDSYDCSNSSANFSYHQQGIKPKFSISRKDDLKGAPDDIKFLSALFSLSGYEIFTLINSNATAEKMQSFLEEFVDKINLLEDKNCLIVLSYTAHGVKEQSDKLTIRAHQSALNEPESIELGTLLSSFKKLKKGNVLISLDTCYSGKAGHYGPSIDCKSSKLIPCNNHEVNILVSTATTGKDKTSEIKTKSKIEDYPIKAYGIFSHIFGSIIHESFKTGTKIAVPKIVDEINEERYYTKTLKSNKPKPSKPKLFRVAGTNGEEFFLENHGSNSNL